MQSDNTDHQCCTFGGLRSVSMFGLSLNVWWNRFSVPPNKSANESSRVYALTGSSASPHTHTHMCVYTKDTVLSALVLCGVHTGESSSHTTEKLEGGKIKRTCDLSYRRSDTLRKTCKNHNNMLSISAEGDEQILKVTQRKVTLNRRLI